MASSSLTSTPISSSFRLIVPNCPKSFSSPIISFSQCLVPFSTKSRSTSYQRRIDSGFSIQAQTLDFSDSFFEGEFGSDDEPNSPGTGFTSPGTGFTSPGTLFTSLEEKEEPQCPPGLRKYETMAVLRPDMSEDERLALTQKYEELLVAGGGMYVEVFNRGIIPMTYVIKKKNKAGESNTYWDGIYLLFTYFTKPESIKVLEDTLKADDDVIRSTTFQVRKRKY